jgi:hypothetical protein
VQIELTQDFGTTSFSLMLYGQAGIGKTTFACRAPKPLVINLENGLKGIDLKTLGAFSTNQLTTYADVLTVFEKSLKSDRFGTLIVDTATRLQDLIIKHICEADNKKSLADFAYGSGYARFAAEAQLLCQWLDSLKAAGKNVILVAHEAIETFADPESDAYDRFNCSLDKRIGEKIRAAVDHIWYMHNEKTLRESSSGRNQARLRGRTLVQTKASGGVVAKTRGNYEQFIEIRNDETDREIWTRL